MPLMRVMKQGLGNKIFQLLNTCDIEAKIRQKILVDIAAEKDFN